MDAPRLGRRRWRSAAVWRRVFSVAVIGCAAAFAVNVIYFEVRPGELWSMSYGAVASALLVGAALYGLRRRAVKTVSRRNLGRSRSWLYFHIYGGSLFLLLVLMHTGFRLPTGAMNWWLWGLSIWTVLSGLVGVILQTWIPRVLASGLAVEVLYERIPELVDEIREKAESLVGTCQEPVQALYRRSMEPALAGPQRRFIYYFDITGGSRTRMKEFDYLQDFLIGAERSKLAELENLYKSKLEIDAHYTLQRALRGWLYLHAPPSLLLFALVVVHLLSVLYY